MAQGPGQTVDPVAAEHRLGSADLLPRRPGTHPARRGPRRIRRHADQRDQPGRPRALSRGLGRRDGRQEGTPRPHRAGRHVLPRRPPPPVGSGPPRGRGDLPRGLPPPGPAAPAGPGRRRHGPGRGSRQPRPVGEPGLPADHPHPHPLRAADHRRHRHRRRLRRPRRRRRTLPPLLQPEDEARGTRAHRRRTGIPHRRPAGTQPVPVARRHPGPVPAPHDQHRRHPARRRRHLPGSALPLAGELRHPRRARQARAPNSPSMAAHARDDPDQPGTSRSTSCRRSSTRLS